MTPEERLQLAAMAQELFAAGRAEDVVSDLAGSGLADEVWADAEATAGLFEQHGLHAATSRLLDHAVLRPSAGEMPGRVVHPLLGTAVTPGCRTGGRVVVDGVVLNATGELGDCAVAVDDGRVVLVGEGRLTAVPHLGFDPDLAVARVRGEVAEADVRELRLSTDEITVRVARAVAFELLGIAEAAIERAKLHVIERHQFGRPLGAFQVVRHRLASAQIATSGARELALATDDTVSADVARLIVKAVAGRAALLAVGEAQQVCGGMGFTAEFGLHRLVRRAYLLDSLLGGSESAEFDLGELAMAGQYVPDRLVAL